MREKEDASTGLCPSPPNLSFSGIPQHEGLSSSAFSFAPLWFPALFVTELPQVHWPPILRHCESLFPCSLHPMICVRETFRNFLSPCLGSTSEPHPGSESWGAKVCLYSFIINSVYISGKCGGKWIDLISLFNWKSGPRCIIRHLYIVAFQLRALLKYL